MIDLIYTRDARVLKKMDLLKEEQNCIKTLSIKKSEGCPIELPSVWLMIFENQQEKYIRGLNIDFGFFTTEYIKERKKKQVIHIVIDQLIEMSNVYVRNIIENELFDNLFDGQLSCKGHWQNIMDQANQERIKKLKRSYTTLNTLINRPKESNILHFNDIQLFSKENSSINDKEPLSASL